MIKFILNNQLVSTSHAGGMTLLDYIRDIALLKGTKSGCREGDCGACTVLVGRLTSEGSIQYRTTASCLTPIINIHGAHIVTIEGLSGGKLLTPIQKNMVDFNATQCGFCTPGFVMAFTGYAIDKRSRIKGISNAVSGNICRCTGYKSIERAGNNIESLLKQNVNDQSLDWLIKNHWIPEYFKSIPDQLQAIPPKTETSSEIHVGGGTDLFVKNADILTDKELNPLLSDSSLKVIEHDGYVLKIGASVTPNELLENESFLTCFPEITSFFKLISSGMIRNMGTIAGNIVNASPIGDLSIWLLSLNANINLMDLHLKTTRELALKDFFLSYKKTALKQNEIITSIIIPIVSGQRRNQQKVSKRTHLDIASVNSAISIELRNNEITSIHIAAGGVAPIPLYLNNTIEYMRGKILNTELIQNARKILQMEINPIDDIRGSVEYKRLLCQQLFNAHFIELFPDLISVEDLLNLPIDE